MIRNVSELYGKKFDALGFQRDIPEGKGLSFRGFMSRILRIQKFAVALDAEEQRGAYAFIDYYVRRAYDVTRPRLPAPNAQSTAPVRLTSSSVLASDPKRWWSSSWRRRSRPSASMRRIAGTWVRARGSRFKKLGAKQYRRTSNFSGPHKLVTDKQGLRAVPINEASKTYTVPKWISESWQQNH